MAAIVTRKGEEARRIERTHFGKEDALQKYLSENPEAIPIEDISDQKPFLLDREFPVSTGFIDILCTDGEGSLYIVETKLFRNPDKRYVLAQVMDYGAALYKAGSNNFMATLEERFQSKNNLVLSEALKRKSMDYETVKVSMKSAIEDGNVRFVILMDEVPADLKDLIVFVNQSSSFKVFLVEMEHYKLENNEIVIPRIFGEELLKPSGRGTAEPATIWDEDRFLNDLRRRTDESTATTAKAIIEWFKPRQKKIYWGQGTTKGSYVPALIREEVEYYPFSMLSTGWIQVYFQYYIGRPPWDSIEVRRDLMDRLNKIDGVKIQELSLDRRPSIDLRTLARPGALQKFLDAFEWMISLI